MTCRFFSLEDGFFLFKFSSFDESQKISVDGPWVVNGHPLVLKRWTEDIDMQKHEFQTCKIASLIGNPLYMDQATATGTRVEFSDLKLLITISRIKISIRREIVSQTDKPLIV